MEALLGILAIIGAATIFGIILNPFFWQGFRNSKFWDEQMKAEVRNSKFWDEQKKASKTDEKNLIDPDNKEI